MASNLDSSLGGLENTLNEYFGKKAPQLPANVKEIIVKLAPWLILIGVVLSLPLLLAAFGLGAVLSPFGVLEDVTGYGRNMVSIVILAVAVVLEAMAIPGLFARARKGWKLVLYGTLLSFVSSLVALDIFGAVIGALLGLYLLFQVRAYYK